MRKPNKKLPVPIPIRVTARLTQIKNATQAPAIELIANRDPRPGFKQRSANGSANNATGKKHKRPNGPKWKKKPERKRNRKRPASSRWTRPAQPFKHTPKPELDYQHGLAIGIFVGAVLVILLLALLVLLGLVELKMLNRSLIEFFA